MTILTMVEGCPTGYKTLWEKDKLLVMSNFSLYHSVFKRVFLQTHKNMGLCGKGFETNELTACIIIGNLNLAR